MTQLVPNRFLFDFEFPLRRILTPPALDGKLTGWTDAYRLPDLGELDNARTFAPVWAGWHESGLFVACRVEGKRQPLKCDPLAYWQGDNLRLCIDTRDARNIRRASRFCRQVYILPPGAGPRGDRPTAGAGKFTQAREHAPPASPSDFTVAAHATRTGYTLEAHIHARALPGWDPVEHPRIGFYYMLEDADHGQQYLTVGDDLYWFTDPSSWATAVLVRE